jgi:metabolite-proton symporter
MVLVNNGPYFAAKQTAPAHSARVGQSREDNPMAFAEAAVSGLTEAEHSVQLRRAVIASTVGTTIEFYDFLVYGQMAALVFAKLYFPSSDPLSGTLQAFAVFAVGFLARPVGAALFGHFGDRIGRKATLIATLLVTGLSTFAVGCVPTYEQIGVWGAVILVLLRFIQGMGVGGEWGGSVLLSIEWARSHHNRGFIASWPQFGGPAGIALANLAVLVFSAISGDQFLVWGWRIPFLLSIVMVGIGLYIRLGILETPTFQRLAAENRLEKAPVVEVLRRQPKEVILSAFARMGEQAPFYIFTAFVFSYGTGELKVSRNLLLVSVLCAAVLSFFTVPFSGHLSDRFGRRRIYILGAVVTGVYTWIYFGLLNTTATAAIFIGIFLSLIPHDLMYGPQAALIAESFTGRLRYSGASIGYQLASIIAGGPAPLIATGLLAAYHNWIAIAAYMTACALISVVATALMKDYTNRDISAEYDRPA